MVLNDFLISYGGLIAIGFQAIYIGILGLIHYLKNKSNPEVLEKKRVKLLNKLGRILTKIGYKEEEGE